jgi:hypothetical protein
MSINTWVEVLAEAQADGTALSNTLTATSLLPPHARATLFPRQLRFVGQQLRVTAAGRISTVVTTPGTLTLDFRLGPTGNIIAWNGGAMALNVVAKTNVTWSLSLLLTVRAVGNGTSANLIGVGEFKSEAVIGSPLPSAGGSGLLLLPASAPAVGTGFDSTVSMVGDLFGTWSVANASNSIQLHQYTLESLN